MPYPLLSTGDEGKNQDGYALVGAKDGILSSTCSHQTFAARNQKLTNIIDVIYEKIENKIQQIGNEIQ